MAWNSRDGITHQYADLGDVRLHYATAGDGPLVVLLHGFPEFWYSWRHQLPALAAAGFRAVAPDMRGYNLSDKPSGIDRYDLRYLTRDVARLIRACGGSQAVVAGHDWGGVVAWSFAMRYPAMLDRLVILNAPHPAGMPRALFTSLQLLRSWYVLYFQLPWLPEAGLRASGFAPLRLTLRTDPVRPDAFTAEEIERYVEAFSQPGALTSAINYYRALLQRSPLRARNELRPIAARVQVIWGEQDRYLDRQLAHPDPAWAPDCRVNLLPDAGHWVQNDRPERVNELITEFLGERGAGSE